MSWKRFFFSSQGRIGRQGFWLGFTIFFVVEYAIMILLILRYFTGHTSSFSGADPTIEFATLACLLCWFLPAAFLPVWIKRWHDLNQPAQIAFTVFVPGIGLLVLFVAGGFLRGTIGPNRFGPDPLAKP